MTLRPSLLVLFSTLATLVASCTSKAGPPEYDDPDIAGRTTNPEGVAYPTDHIGSTARAAARPGDRIQNFTFMAYVDGNTAAGLEPVSLADFYDPTSKRAKILDLQVSATWCSVCSAVTSATVPEKAKLATEGAIFLEVVASGDQPNRGPSLDEVDAWIASHMSNVTTGLDVRGHRLGNIDIGLAMPFDILIDLRTMEMLDASAGPPMTISGYVHEGLDFVASHPPTY